AARTIQQFARGVGLPLLAMQPHREVVRPILGAIFPDALHDGGRQGIGVRGREWKREHGGQQEALDHDPSPSRSFSTLGLYCSAPDPGTMVIVMLLLFGVGLVTMGPFCCVGADCTVLCGALGTALGTGTGTRMGPWAWVRSRQAAAWGRRSERIRPMTACRN